MNGQLPNKDQATRLLQWAYQISYWDAVKIHESDSADWWTQAGEIVGVEAYGRGYVELEPEPVKEAGK